LTEYNNLPNSPTINLAEVPGFDADPQKEPEARMVRFWDMLKVAEAVFDYTR
jgi:hypothetical protein